MEQTGPNGFPVFISRQSDYVEIYVGKLYQTNERHSQERHETIRYDKVPQSCDMSPHSKLIWSAKGMTDSGEDGTFQTPNRLNMDTFKFDP